VKRKEKRRKHKMVKIPEDIKEGIVKIAGDRGIEPDVLVKKMEELIKTSPVIQTLTKPEEKIQVAWGLLASKYVRGEGGSGKKYHFYVLSVNGPRKTTSSKVTEVLGIAMAEKGKMIYGKLSAWQENADIAAKLTRKKEYVLEVRGAITADGLDGTLVDKAEIEISKAAKISPDTFFEEVYESDRKCTIADAELNVIDPKKEKMNFRILRCTVLGARPGEKDGKTYCTFNVIDSTFTTGEKSIGFNISGNGDQLVCGAGSISYFLGPIIKTVKGNQSRLKMVGSLVWPITLIPYEAPEEEDDAADEVNTGEEGQ
jgi:hypothetical protein